ncbi:MAG: response regulator [Thermoleophilaceae bacterium]|nr:response regulator [Thermoleophilaceae bacterium]
MDSVLIVDDDPFIRKLIWTTLENVATMQLISASDGLEAVEVAGREHPSLILLDIDMPNMNGIECCRVLRAAEGTSESTIVMLTAASRADAERESEAAGADLFLTKPFSPLELLQLVDDLGGGMR